MAEGILEVDIERPASKYARARGWFEVKIMQTSRRAFPDRFYARDGRVVLVEYKRPGESPSKQQAKRHRELREHGVEVYVFDDLQTAKQFFR